MKRDGAARSCRRIGAPNLRGPRRQTCRAARMWTSKWEIILRSSELVPGGRQTPSRGRGGYRARPDRRARRRSFGRNGELSSVENCTADPGQRDVTQERRTTGPNVVYIGPHHCYSTESSYAHVRGGQSRVRDREVSGCRPPAQCGTMRWRVRHEASGL